MGRVGVGSMADTACRGGGDVVGVGDVSVMLVIDIISKKGGSVKPIDFPAANCMIGGEIPANRTNHGFILSQWEMTWRERLAILFYGKVWLAVKSDRMPAILLSGDQTFRIRER